MKPIKFEEQTKELQKPSSMTDDECGSLPVFCDGNECVSKWKMSFAERLHCLFRGFIWVRIFSGNTQPPILIEPRETVFIKPKKERIPTGRKFSVHHA